jgi:hypothetical protein
MKKTLFFFFSLFILPVFVHAAAPPVPSQFASWSEMTQWTIDNWSGSVVATNSGYADPVPFAIVPRNDGSSIWLIITDCSYMEVAEHSSSGTSFTFWFWEGGNADCEMPTNYGDIYSWNPNTNSWSYNTSLGYTHIPWGNDLCHADLSALTSGISVYRRYADPMTNFNSYFCGDFSDVPENGEMLLWDSFDLAAPGSDFVGFSSGNYWSPRFPDLDSGSSSSLALFRVQADVAFPFVFWLTHNTVYSDDLDFGDHVRVVDSSGVDVSSSLGLTATIVDDYASDPLGSDGDPNKSNVFLSIDTTSIDDVYVLQYFAEGFSSDLTASFSFRVVTDSSGEEPTDTPQAYAGSPNDYIDDDRSWIVNLIFPYPGYFDSSYSALYDSLTSRLVAIEQVRTAFNSVVEDTSDVPVMPSFTISLFGSDMVLDFGEYYDTFALARTVIGWSMWVGFAFSLLYLHRELFERKENIV